MSRRLQTVHDDQPDAGPSPLQFIKGIGPVRAAALAELGIHSVHDLLLFTPRAYLDRRTVLPLRTIRVMLMGDEVLPDEVTAVVEVRRMKLLETGRGRKRVVMRVGDVTGEANLVFFQGAQYFLKAYAPDDLIAVSGSPEMFSGTLQWVHPELERLEKEEEAMIHSGRIIPRYRETAKMKSAGLTSRSLRALIRHLLDSGAAVEVVETLPVGMLEQYDLLPMIDSVRHSHFPDDENLLASAQRRMKFQELFLFELGMVLRREVVKTRTPGISFRTETALPRQLLDRVGFELTRAQRSVLREILADMSAPQPMNRLLQGDVGSGKTIVAVIAMLVAVENGYQCAFMAPTEILAEQHFRTLKKVLGNLPVRVAQLVGGQKKRAREELLYRIRNNEESIIVGTHALFQDDVEFANLGFAVIDEQHRFGVEQRARLMNKGRRPDTLIMTATPIPRTLTMSVFGDLDVSVIDEMPAGRMPVKTAVRFESAIDSVWDFVRSEVRQGRQAYVVYPLVEKSEKLDLKSAVEHYEYLRSTIFPDLRLGLLHGQMFWYEKEEMLDAFLQMKIDIVIATTVIEVGIDVPNASVMVIENAERFGLSQLHQLRGRVGRSSAQSYCILVTKDHYRYHLRKGMTQTEARSQRQSAIHRLAAMASTTDGFRISEIDLELRGPGDLTGTRQSGLPEFRHANLVTDGPIVVEARNAALAIVESDPDLLRPEHAGLREALKIEAGRISQYADVG